jgi:hypothetical protein
MANMINHGREILLDHYIKHHMQGATWRLIGAFAVVCALIGMTAVVIINAMSGACMFIPS